eukprot:2969476-Amphidinium_carterae.2
MQPPGLTFRHHLVQQHVLRRSPQFVMSHDVKTAVASDLGRVFRCFPSSFSHSSYSELRKDWKFLMDTVSYPGMQGLGATDAAVLHIQSRRHPALCSTSRQIVPRFARHWGAN